MKEKNLFRKLFAGMLAGGMLLLSSSCGLFQMRDPYTEDDLLVESTGEAAAMLTPAERKNMLGNLTAASESEQGRTTAAEEADSSILTLAFTGDVRIDGSIIKDAANRAADGKSYSFLRMYAGIFHSVKEADVAFGSYSAAKNPTGDEDIAHKTPVESLAALSDLGFELLDTTEAGDLSIEIGEYNMNGLSADVKSDNGVRIVEKEGFSIAFLSLGDKTHRHSYEKENTAENIEYADLMADFVVVSVNWADGISTEAQRAAVLKMAEAGADVIVGDGDQLGTVEWIDAGDDGMTLAVYSLGCVLSSAQTMEGLCGGVLTMEIDAADGQLGVGKVCLRPTVIHYGVEAKDYQIFELGSYTDELAVKHGVKDISCDGLLSFVRSVIPAEFLPVDLRG